MPCPATPFYDDDPGPAAPELDPVEVTDGDREVAYECLKRCPWDRSPVNHIAEILARYRLKLARGE